MSESAPRAPRDGGERGGEPEHLVVGHVASVHGTKGEVFVWPLTDRPESLFEEGRVLLLGDQKGALPATPETVVIERARPFKRGFLVRFEGCLDRSDAEPLARRYLVVETGGLEPLGEGELFYHQLLGLEVVTVKGERVGTVREVFETEPAHLLEVDAGERVHLIPLGDWLVREVDVAGGRLVIDPPEGLLEL